jgi:hypothetical protein
MSIASGNARPPFLPELDELPTGGIVREITLGPRKHHAGTNAIDDTLGNDHQWHLVFGAARSIEFLQSWLVSEINFLSGSFKDDNIVPGFQVNGDGWIMREVASLAGRAGGSEVKATVDPESPHRNGVRTAIASGCTYPVIAGFGEALLGVSKRQEFVWRFQSIERGDMGKAHGTAFGSRLLFRGFFRGLRFRHGFTSDQTQELPFLAQKVGGEVGPRRHCTWPLGFAFAGQPRRLSPHEQGRLAGLMSPPVG